MRVGVIGAGVAGLAAARRLSKGGVQCTVFEAADVVGGRAKTLEVEWAIVDVGLQTYTPRGLAIGLAILEELPRSDLLRVEKPVYILAGGRATAGSEEKNAQARYTYRQGAAEFPRLMADGLDVRLGTEVRRIEKRDGGYAIGDERFDALIITPPAPETERLLRSMGSRRHFGNISYRPCLSVALGFDEPTPPVPYYALLSADRNSAVLWLGIETAKAPGRAPEGKSVFVAQMGPAYSRQYLHASAEYVVQTAVSLVSRLFGAEYRAPAWVHVHRWAYSQPERVAYFESVNPPGERVIVAGDGTLAGRAENAYETGLMAAERILAWAADRVG